MFYIEWNNTRFTDINELTLKEVQELLNSLKGSKLRYDEDQKNDK